MIRNSEPQQGPGYGPGPGPGYGPGYQPHPGMGRGSAPPPLLPPPPPPPPKGPDGLVWKVVGGVLGVVVLLALGIVVFVNSAVPTRSAADGTTERAGTLSAIDLRAGDCYNDTTRPAPPGTYAPINTVEVVPCTTAHTDQVIDKIYYKGSDDYTDVQDNRAMSDCDESFQTKVAPSVADDPEVHLGIILAADATTWMNNPVVACTVTHPSRTTSLLQ